jgi:hypothetical protein
MLNTKAQAELMRFLFISNTNTFATYTCGFLLRFAAFLLTAVTAFFESWILYIMVESTGYDLSVVMYQFALAILWISMLSGPITQDFSLCYALTIAMEIATIIDFIIKIAILVYIYNPISDSQIPFFTVIEVYLALLLISAFVYYSYTKSLGLGLLSVDVFQNNHQGTSFIHSCGTAPKNSFTVEQCPTIVLKHSNDLVFIREIQDSIVNNITLPSGIVVPSGGNGSNWKVVGKNIILV